MQENALVITGMGAVTPLGLDIDSYWNALIAGRTGIGPITRFAADALPVRIAAEVKDFHPEKLIPPSCDKNMGLFAKYGYVAAKEALRDAGLEVVGDPNRIGIVMGTALDGMGTLADAQAQLSTGAMRKAGPRLVPSILGNIPAGMLAIDCGIHGPCVTVNTACSSGGDAVMVAEMILRRGDADIMLVVGAESIISPILISSLAAAKALSRRNDEPGRACRPFDKDRDGFVIGEGGGALVLETAAHAARRGVSSYAAVAGTANTQDGYHVTSPDPEGEGAMHCMFGALRQAGMQPSDIDYLNAHGTATVMGDKVEALAVKRVFGDAGHGPYVSSTKGATGHMMGAGGLTEIIACVKALQTATLPPTLNYETPDPDCAVKVVANKPVHAEIRAAMSNSLGFGGQNSSVILTRDSNNRR